MRLCILFIVTLLFLGAKAVSAQPPKADLIRATQADASLTPKLRKEIEKGKKKIETFFGHPFATPFTTEIFPDRASLDAFFQKRWNAPKTEKWMVAAGVADYFALLSPRVWTTEAVEHDPRDTRHVHEIITHELVHVYHGQRNPSGNFDGMDDLAWFAEGLAVYVSGQLERDHKDDAAKAIAEGKAPAHLAEAWSGRYRYGVSGSLVRYIDSRYGRETLWKLLPVTRPEQALQILGVTETEFLRDWRNDAAQKASVKPASVNGP